MESAISVILAPSIAISATRVDRRMEEGREGVGCSEQEALGTRRKHPWLNDSGGRKRIEVDEEREDGG